MSKRINVVLPDKTLKILNRVATRGNRSKLISNAILQFVESQGKANLRERLKQEAIANATRDLEIAAEWFPLDREAEAMLEAQEKKGRADTPRRKSA
jgi:CopG family transcriptional regulator / antitoxin EndoAI